MQKITISTSELKSALAGFSKVITKRTTLPVLGCILFESKQGQITLTATNLDDYVTRVLAADDTAETFKAVIPYEALQKIAKSCSNVSSLTLTQQKEEVLIQYPLAGTVLTERVAGLDVKEFPPIPEPTWHNAITVGDEFKEAVAQALDSASTDESRYILHHAYVDVSDPKAHYIVGTNGREMFAANSFKLHLKESLIVPNRKFLGWKGFMQDGDWTIALGGPEKKEQVGWIKVQSKGWTLITRQIDGEYPHWRAPIPASGDKSTVRFTEDAAAFIQTAAPRLPGSTDINSPVGIVMTKEGSVLLQGKTNDHSVSLPVTGAVGEGGATSRTMNRNYLVKAMKLGLTDLDIYENNHVVVFRNAGKRLVVACLRDENQESASSIRNDQPSTPEQESGSSPAQEPSSEEPQEQMRTTNRIEATEVTTTTASSADTTAASAFVEVKDHMEKVRDRLKEVVSDLNDAIKLLNQAQKEKKATEREIESIRETLRGLQQVRI